MILRKLKKECMIFGLKVDFSQLVINQNVGIRIKGAFSRCLAQKSFNVYTRSDYGLTEFDYDFFSGKAVKAKNGKAIKKFDGVVLRNGGNDNTGAFFRDSINQSLVADRGFAHQAVSECILFIDGEFWGIYQMMEKINKSFLSDHYGVKKSDIAMIENGALEEGTDQDPEAAAASTKPGASTTEGSKRQLA